MLAINSISFYAKNVLPL